MKANSIILLLNIYNNNNLGANVEVMNSEEFDMSINELYKTEMLTSSGLEVTHYGIAAHCITEKGEDIINKILSLN